MPSSPKKKRGSRLVELLRQEPAGATPLLPPAKSGEGAFLRALRLEIELQEQQRRKERLQQ